MWSWTFYYKVNNSYRNALKAGVSGLLIGTAGFYVVNVSLNCSNSCLIFVAKAKASLSMQNPCSMRSIDADKQGLSFIQRSMSLLLLNGQFC